MSTLDAATSDDPLDQDTLSMSRSDDISRPSHEGGVVQLLPGNASCLHPQRLDIEFEMARQFSQDV